jgi:hypothetical protein
MLRGSKQIRVLAALHGQTRPRGKHPRRFVVASQVAETVASTSNLPLHKGEIQLILDRLANEGLVEYRETQVRLKRQGRQPMYEWATTKAGKTEVESLVALSR